MYLTYPFEIVFELGPLVGTTGGLKALYFLPIDLAL
jgi:hypothetical protein